MYIVAIGWIYVTLMMSIAEQTAIAGVMTFLLYGVFPVSIILYLLHTPERRRRREAAKSPPADTITPDQPTIVAAPHSNTSVSVDPDQ
jgi:hypothetical protein